MSGAWIPTIFSIIPVTGSRLGGDQVEIRGENLCSLRAGQAGGFECVGAPTVTFALGAPLNSTLNAGAAAGGA